MSINKLKNERHQNINNERKFTITKMLHNFQKQRKDMMKQNKCMYLNVQHCLISNININTNNITFIFCLLKNPTGSNTGEDLIDLSGSTSNKIYDSSTIDAISDSSCSITAQDNEKSSHDLSIHHI